MNRLNEIHSNLKFRHGNLKAELQEQIMSSMFLTGDEKVLELGSNIGRNSCVVGYILNKKNNFNFVTLETEEKIIPKLKENREINNLKFYIENRALSSKKRFKK